MLEDCFALHQFSSRCSSVLVGGRRLPQRARVNRLPSLLAVSFCHCLGWGGLVGYLSTYPAIARSAQRLQPATELELLSGPPFRPFHGTTKLPSFHGSPVARRWVTRPSLRRRVGSHDRFPVTTSEIASPAASISVSLLLLLLPSFVSGLFHSLFSCINNLCSETSIREFRSHPDSFNPDRIVRLPPSHRLHDGVQPRHALRYHAAQAGPVPRPIPRVV